MSLAASLASVSSIPSVLTQRKISALVGSIVADAASLHLQWVYDQDSLNTIVGGRNPEFWPESKCPFYTLPNGAVSCYADEIVTSLHSMVMNSNSFLIPKVCEDIAVKFGAPNSPYQVALAKRQDKQYPIDGPWINGGVMKFIENYHKLVTPPGSSNCDDHDGLAIALPWIIQSCTSGHLPWNNLKEGVEILSTNLTALRHYEVEASLLNDILHPELAPNPIANVKSYYKNVYPEVVAEIEAVQIGKGSGLNVNQLVKQFGMACPLPGSFQGALASIIGAKSYEDAIRGNIIAGGDSCSRGLLIGAYLGAKFGIMGIPIEWLSKVDNIEYIISEAKQIFT